MAQLVKNLPANARKLKRPGLDPWVVEILCSRKWQSTLLLLPEKLHGQRTLLQSIGLQKVRYN